MGDLVEWTFVTERVRPQTDQCQADAFIELGGDHAGRLVHHVPEVGPRLELDSELAGRGVRLQRENSVGGDVGRDERVGVLFGRERTRPVAVQIERSEPHGSHAEREAEDRPHTRVDRWSGERGPAGRAGISQIRFEHGSTEVVGVDAGTLPELVLELLDELAHLVGGAHRPAGQVTCHQHDPRPVHAREFDAHGAQVLRRQLGSIAQELGDDPSATFTRQG